MHDHGGRREWLLVGKVPHADLEGVRGHLTHGKGRISEIKHNTANTLVGDVVHGDRVSTAIGVLQHQLQWTVYSRAVL